MLEGLVFLHESCQRLHGDLKPESILLLPDARAMAVICQKAVNEARNVSRIDDMELPTPLEQEEIEKALKVV